MYNKYKNMEPQKYYDNQDPASPNLIQKKKDMIENKNNLYIATEKRDGEWGMFIKGENGQILIRSRSISKVTGEYGDKTALLPHLVEEMQDWPNGSVVLAEICWDEYNTVSTDVGTIMRCLPAKAIERQKDKKLVARIFDLLAWDGVEYDKDGYETRLNKALEVFQNKESFFAVTEVFYENFAENADEIISMGGEGVVIQKKTAIYAPGKRTAWESLKLKQQMPEMELRVLAAMDPNMEYEGKDPENWPFWYDTATGDLSDHYEDSGFIPVTKPWFAGWKNGVTVDYEGNSVDVTSGLTDMDREWLSTKEAEEKIKNGELYAVVRAMMENTKGKLRHPVLVRLRDDVK